MKGRIWVTGAAVVLVVVSAIGLFALDKVRVRTTKFAGALPSMENISPEDLDRIAKNRIFFGHQSVGDNILEGMIEILDDNQEYSMNIVEGSDFSLAENGVFFHKKIGRNTRPSSKIRAFKRSLVSNAGNQVDVALMKFCYIDLGRDSDPHLLFNEYQSAMSELKLEFPELVVVHMTVPLESSPRGAKGLVKEMLKMVMRRSGVVDDNRVREAYNEMLRTEYSGKEPIFDIALVESIGPNGMRAFRGTDADRVYVMDGRFTQDGGHLNQPGRRHVAEQFLATLAEAAGMGGE